MEAVAALSLGCNVLQLIDYAIRSGHLVRDIYKNGKVTGSDDLNTNLMRLEQLASLSKELSKDSYLNASRTSDRELIRKTALSCETEAKTIQKALAAYATSRDRSSRVKLGLRAVFKQSPAKIQQSEERLEKHRKWLDSTIIQVIGADVRRLVAEQKVGFDGLDEQSKRAVQRMDEGFKKLEIGQRETEANITSRLEKDFQERAKDKNALEAQAQTRRDRDRLIKSLIYDGMNSRIGSLDDGDEDTFRWIFDPDHRELHHSFVAWLGNEEPLYWIQGLAGCGKSILMKKIWGDEMTKILVTNNDSARSFLIIKHSFWLPAKSKLEKNFKGMLLNIAHALLSQNDAAAEMILDRHGRFKAFEACSDWREEDLKRVMFDALANTALFDRKCLFLDALDEIETQVEQSKCASFLIELSKFEDYHIKICVSSRPERPWTDNFRDKPQLRLEDLTRKDIRIFVTKLLSSRLPVDEDGSMYSGREAFFDFFIEKSRGLFLWAFLVSEALLKYPSHSPWDDFYQRLDEFPSGMMDLYMKLLARCSDVSESVMVEAATYLKLCLHPLYGKQFYGGNSIGRYSGDADGFLLHQALPIWKQMRGHHMDDYDVHDQKTFWEDYRKLEQRILDICAGLLKPNYGQSLMSFPYSFPDGDPSHPGPEKIQWTNTRHKVVDSESEAEDAVWFRFAHRTAADFFTDVPEGRAFIERCSLTRSQILIKHIDAEMLRWRLRSSKMSFCCIREIGPLADIIVGIWQIARKDADKVSDADVCQGFQMVKDTLTELPLMSCNGSILNHADKAALQMFYLARNDSTSWNYLIALDIEGLLLELGIDAWFSEKQKRFVCPAAVSGDSYTSTYKNYLLICAVKGNLPDIAAYLIENGADFYAECWLPLSRPTRRSAANHLLYLASMVRLSTTEIQSWAKIYSSIAHQTQYVLGVVSCHGYERVWYWSSNLHPGMYELARMKNSMLSSCDVSLKLSLWLQYALPSTNKNLAVVPLNTCVGHLVSLDDETLEIKLVPILARSWRGIGGWDTPRETFPHVVPRHCNQCLADEGDEFWKTLSTAFADDFRHKHCPFTVSTSQEFQDVWSKEPLWSKERWPHHDRMMEELMDKYLLEEGYYKRMTDSGVSQGPLVVFQSEGRSPDGKT